MGVAIGQVSPTGLAAWSPFGGRIEMPTMDRLAGNGLTYWVGSLVPRTRDLTRESLGASAR